jgi:hypothetical protein
MIAKRLAIGASRDYEEMEGTNLPASYKGPPNPALNNNTHGGPPEFELASVSVVPGMFIAVESW